MESYQQFAGDPEPIRASAEPREEAMRAFATRPSLPVHELAPPLTPGRVDAAAPGCVEEEVSAPRRVPEQPVPASEPAGPRILSESAVAEFTALVLRESMPAAMRFIEAAHAEGVPIESLYVDLLEPAARRLGEMWMADLCSFAEVTMATARLQVALRETSALVPLTVQCVQHGRRLLLAPAGGEQHMFGLLIVADLFTRAGWDVWGGARPGDEVLKLARDEWFDVVGLSVGCLPRLEALTLEIRRIRSSSRNRELRVMVGGAVFTAHPEYVARVGADASAIDGRQATKVAEALVAARAGPC